MGCPDSSRQDLSADLSKSLLGQAPETVTIPDPFTNSLNLSKLDLIKCVVGTLIFLPFRALGVALTLGVAWAWARVGLALVQGPTDDTFSRAFKKEMGPTIESPLCLPSCGL